MKLGVGRLLSFPYNESGRGVQIRIYILIVLLIVFEPLPSRAYGSTSTLRQNPQSFKASYKTFVLMFTSSGIQGQRRLFMSFFFFVPEKTIIIIILQFRFSRYFWIQTPVLNGPVTKKEERSTRGYLLIPVFPRTFLTILEKKLKNRYKVSFLKWLGSD